MPQLRVCAIESRGWQARRPFSASSRCRRCSSALLAPSVSLPTRWTFRTIAAFREQLLELSSRVLTPDVVQSVIEPTLDDVLSRGRAGVISIGFIIALWAGSRALNVFVDTITIMYGMAGQRGLVRTRALSFALYLVFLMAGIVVLPLILAGPSLVSRVLPLGLETIALLYWPVVLLGSACMLATLYHLSVPVRTRWRADLPGAAVTVAMWVGGSILLRFVLSKSIGSPTIYGPLAAPIAFLIWLYVISIAVLIGAALNSAIDEVFPGCPALIMMPPAPTALRQATRRKMRSVARLPEYAAEDAVKSQ